MRVGRYLRVLLALAASLLLSLLLWTHSYEGATFSTAKSNKMTPHKGPDLTTRTAAVKKVCDKLAPSESRTPPKVIMTNREHKLAYCYIPKCGCTFWKRVMRFLNKDYKGDNITTPFQIPRMEVHLKWSNPDTFVKFNMYKKMPISFNSFIFVREPYARLWSAYVDKLYLPDLWQELRQDIISKRPKSEANKCVSDVTFEEFAKLVHHVYEPHWQPMHEMCDPCSFKPTTVARVESFSSDSRAILKHANLSWILDNYDHVKHVEEELRTLIQYNLKDVIALKPYISKCASRVELMKRLRKAFQITGYIPSDVSLPSVDQTTTVAQFTDIVLDQHRRRPNTPDVWRKQRKEFMIAAYKKMSTATLEKIRKKYQKDFLLFNYDPAPVEIFGYRGNVSVST